MKGLMVLGKSLTLTAILISLVGCSATGTQPYLQAGSIPDSRDANLNSPSSVAGLYSTLLTEISYRLTEEQKRKQTAAVYGALNSDYGEVYRWYEHDARGAVKAVHGFPHNNGFCRVVFSEIESKGRVRQFQETACTATNSNTWKFYPIN